MERATLLRALRRHWWIVVVLTVLGAVAGALPRPATTADVVTRWTAAHTLLLSSTTPGQSIYSDPVTFNQLQLFTTTGEVPARAAEALGFSGAPAALAGQVSVSADQSTGALRISTSQDTADRSIAVADTFADELVTYLAERQDALRQDRLAATLERLDDLSEDVEAVEARLLRDPGDALLAAERDALARQYGAVFEQYNALQADQGQLVLTTLERAQAVAITERGLAAPRSRTSRGFLGAIVGFGAGLCVVLLLSQLDRKLRFRDQVEQVTGLKVQVAIPDGGSDAPQGVVVTGERHDSLSDAYRTLRSVIGFVEGGEAAAAGRTPVVLVVSPGAGDGKTAISANLAASFVEIGSRVLAVNADFRRPALSERIMGFKPAPSSFELGEVATLPQEWLVHRTAIPDLGVVDLAGIPNASPGDLARATSKMLPDLAQDIDVVVVDSSPLGITAEVLELVPLADVIVVTVRMGHTSIDTTKRALEVLRAMARCHLLLVTVGDAAERTGYYYDYSSRDRTAKRRPSLQRK